MSNLLADIRRVVERVDPDQDLVRCEIAAIDIGAGVLEVVPDRVRDMLGDHQGRAGVVVLVDPVDIRVGEVSVKPTVASALQAAGFDVRVEVLDDGHPELHASEEMIAAAGQRAKGADALVSIGGGTITDLGKLACLEVGIPQLVVQTAASVDGFTDNVSVILRNGVKRTVPSRWPDAIVADTDVIAEAPEALNRAGFGEILSMFTAPADWRLADLLGFPNGYHPGPVAMLAEVGRGIDEWSPGLATGEPESTARLVRALDMRGVATGVSGSTACLSGVEHLISHMFDASFAARQLPIGQHGAQVGAGSVFAAATWEHLFDRLAAAGADGTAVTLVDLDRDALHAGVLEAFRPLDADGTLAAECWSDYASKLDVWEANRDRIAAVLDGWSEHVDELRALVHGPDELAIALRNAGVAVRFADLVPQVDADLVRWAVSNCAFMRNRVTVVDLLISLGWWTDADIDTVLRRSQSAGSDGAPAAQAVRS